ncbi:hypothetical protein [Cognatilysobacter terrigena]|uniref:hypothetical protein n=1 Tax=Cognatilysobacter terrigena TaxID=2488749 RepID=UPI00105F43DE|nr:hypothetical protein [Lysobacter terrigena]
MKPTISAMRKVCIAAPLATLNLAIAALLVGMTVAIYWPGLHGGFLFDDIPNLVGATEWRMTEFTADQVRRVVGADMTGAFGRGLAMLTFGLNHLLTGDSLWWMKLTNVLIHALNGVLIWRLSRWMCQRLDGRAGDMAPLLIATAWLLHPLQVSTVLYTIQRMELGAQCMVLACLLAYVRGREASLRGQHSLSWFALAAAFVVVGLGFKESAALAPAFCALIEIFVLRFACRNATTSRQLRIAYGAAAFIAVAIYATYVVPHFATAEMYRARDFSAWQRLLTQPRVLVLYASEALFPLPDRFRFYYDDIVASTDLTTPWLTSVCLLLLLASVGGAWMLRKRRPVLALGLMWFLVAHALTSNVVPLELAFEHRNYLALLGLCWAVFDVGKLLTGPLNRDARLTLGALAVLVLAGATLLQTLTWGDPFRLAVALDARASQSSRAAYGLGVAIYGRTGDDSNVPAWSLAHRQFEVASQRSPHSILGDQAIILMDSRAGRSVPAARWSVLRQKLTSSGDRPENLMALDALVACAMQPHCGVDQTPLGDALEYAARHNPTSRDLERLRSSLQIVGQSSVSKGALTTPLQSAPR